MDKSFWVALGAAIIGLVGTLLVAGIERNTKRKLAEIERREDSCRRVAGGESLGSASRILRSFCPAILVAEFRAAARGESRPVSGRERWRGSRRCAQCRPAGAIGNLFL